MTILSVTNGALSQSVAELATIKSELGITDSSQDAKLTRLIAAVSRSFAGVDGLQRDPWRQTYEEKLPGWGGIYLPLSRWPIESISQLDEGTTTVTATEYSIAQPERYKVYREDGWQRTKVNRPIGRAGSGDENLYYTVDYVGGWLMPDEVATWAASTAYALGDWVQATDLSIVMLFECTTAGTSGASQPTWDETEDAETADNTATFTARPAREMPEDLQEAAIVQVIDWFGGGLQIPSGIKSESFEGSRIEYLSGTVSAMALAPHVAAVCRGYR